MPQKSIVHFDISERKVLLRIMDILCVLLTLSLVGLIFRFDYFRITSDNWVWSLVLVIYLNLFGSIFEIYDLQKAGKFEVILQNVILTVSVTILFFLLTPYFTPSLPENRLQILFFFLAMAGSILLWRFAYITLISSARFYKRVLLVCDAKDLEFMVPALQKSDPNYAIIGFVNTGKHRAPTNIGSLICFEAAKMEELIRDEHINEIVVADSKTRANEEAALLLRELNDLLIAGFSIKDYTQVYEEITYRVPVQHIGHNYYKSFLFSRSIQNKFYLVFNRVFDILLSILGIVICVLLIPFIVVGNILGNSGALFYIQERVGKNGENFKIWKFRTMKKNSEEHGPVWADKNDHRVTVFGKFLRRTRIDEIPQFYNVLKAEMSVIGPRPERPVFVKELAEIIPFYKTRHIIKPGLTGWAQVKANYGSSHTDSLEKLQYDLYYIKHRGLFLDINILLKTLSTILFFRGQ